MEESIHTSDDRLLLGLSFFFKFSKRLPLKIINSSYKALRKVMLDTAIVLNVMFDRDLCKIHSSSSYDYEYPI